MQVKGSNARVALLTIVVGAATVSAWAGSSGTTPVPAVRLDDWLLLGPIPILADPSPAPDEDVQKKAFETDLLAPCGGEAPVRALPLPPCSVAGQNLAWKATRAVDGAVDVAKAVGAKSYAVAYALAEVESPVARTLLLGLGSDDAVKVWLNGKLVHSNWVMRALEKDQDLVPVDLPAGRSQLLLKILNAAGDWGFAARSLDPKALENVVWRAAKGGDVDRIRLVLDRAPGLDVNGRARLGLTPWQIAMVCGQAEAAEFLASKGADTALRLPPPEAILDAMFTDVVHGDSPGAAVLVSKDGKTLFEKAYGYASLEHHVPVTPQTKFRIGSITKQFTAAAILRLQEQGKLSVDDPLSKFVADYPRGSEVRAAPPPDPHFRHPQLHGEARLSRDREGPPQERRGPHRFLPERPLRLLAGRAVVLQQLRLLPAGPHRREGLGRVLRGLPPEAVLRAAGDEGHRCLPQRHDPGSRRHRLRAERDDTREGGRLGDVACRRSGRPLLDRRGPRPLERRPLRGTRPDEGVHRRGVDGRDDGRRAAGDGRRLRLRLGGGPLPRPAGDPAWRRPAGVPQPALPRFPTGT